MPSKKEVAGVRAIGIDTGKSTLHMVGLDEKGAIILREKVSRNRTVTSVIWWHFRPIRALTRMRSDVRGYP